MIQFQYTRATSTKAAVEAINRDATATFIAGGTNLVDLMKRRITTPEKLIDINNLPLKDIESSNGVTRIGALALNAAVAENKMVLATHPLLSQALNAGASAQLRNMATVGGNLMQRTRCPYFYDVDMPCNKREPGTGCGALEGFNRMHAIFGYSNKCIAVNPSDMNVALAALDAVVLVSGAKGDRRIPISDFHRLPGDKPELDTNLGKGELILGVEIPNGPFNKNVHYLKLRDRASYAFALVSVATALNLDGKTIKDARLAMGGVAHKPWRLAEAEKSLIGKQVSEESFRNAANLAMAGAKGFQYNSFKIKMGANAIVEALKSAAANS
jgi:xanthine dehydrogenase YagS FAD-binding subunit